MAIDPRNLLAQLNPLRPLDLSKGFDERSPQRRQVGIAREKFEFDKMQAAEAKELRLLEERGRMAREQMIQERARAEAQAKVEAALLAQQQGALAKVGEFGGTGKEQQLAAMSPLMDQLGYDQNYLGSVNGLGAYDIVNRAQEQARADQEFEQAPRDIAGWDGGESAVQSLNRLQGLGLGYPTNERGALEDPSGADRPAVTGSVDEAVALEPPTGAVDDATGDALSPGDADMATAQEFAGGGEEVADVSVGGRGMVAASLQPGDPFARALAASRAAQEAGGLPARAPDEEDYMGAVPRNRIDLAAMQAQTLKRLNPALQARVDALPEELQPAARANAAAIGGLGLEAGDAIKEMDSAMEDPVSIYNAQQNRLADKEKREALTPVQEEELKSKGVSRADGSFQNAKLGNTIASIQAADTVKSLMKGDKRNHEKAVNFLMKMTVNSGPQTEADALRVIGRGRLSSIDQLEAWLHERIVGGFEKEDIAAINEFVDMQSGRDREKVFGWLATNDQQMRNPKTHERVRAGYEEFRNGGSIPPALLDEYEALAKKAAAGRSGQNAPAAAGAELERQATAAGLNGKVLGQLMSGESGGDPNAASDKSSAKGAFQLIDSTAQAMGFKDAAEYAAQPIDKQIEVGLKLFKNKGLTDESPPEDYALVLAAPSLVGKWKSRDDVVYAKDSAEWKANEPWRPAGGGDITVGSITDYYLKAGRQRAAGADAAEATPVKGAERKASPTNPYANLPEPKTAEEKRIAELLKKRGG